VKTEVKVQRGTRETVFEVDLPIVPEGHTITTPVAENCRVVFSYVDISPASGPIQVVVVAGGSGVLEVPEEV
jgi:hypothetical protein